MNTAINQDLLVKPTNSPLDLPGDYVQVFHHLTYLKVINELKAPKGHTNEFGGGYKYRSAEDIQEALKPVLLKHKCTVITRKFDFDDGFEIYAYMVFKDNTYIVCEVPGVAEFDFDRDLASNKKVSKTQQYAAYQSYAKKYALGNLLQIDDSKDDLDAHSNEIIKNERQKNHVPTQADCDRALKQIEDLPLNMPLEQAVKHFDQIIRTYPMFYEVLNNACCKKHSEIEQHLYAVQNAQHDATAFDNSHVGSAQGNNSLKSGTNQTSATNTQVKKGDADQRQQQSQNPPPNNASKNKLISNQQRDHLQAFINERGLDIKSTCEYLGIDALTQIEASKFEAVKTDIEKFARESINA
ncbi:MULTISPECIES: ERF family protein [Acinetobacter]|uniref:Single-stranded DNA-binding protein n=1 Tax=Acinetobacter higginsii TaxID=70347 RepID=N9RI41_9GAMM|nr:MULTISPECIES: ERF family protein [Acinetobacter]ENX57619.1 hypothetical protein F902_02016 [Acinetobacter higginsii]